MLLAGVYRLVVHTFVLTSLYLRRCSKLFNLSYQEPKFLRENLFGRVDTQVFPSASQHRIFGAKSALLRSLKEEFANQTRFMKDKLDTPVD